MSNINYISKLAHFNAHCWLIAIWLIRCYYIVFYEIMSIPVLISTLKNFFYPLYKAVYALKFIFYQVLIASIIITKIININTW